MSRFLAPALLATALALGLTPTAHAQAATMAVPAPELPGGDTVAAREGWISDCSHRLNAVNQGNDGTEPFRATCAAWLDYFQRAGPAARQPGGGLVIPVSMVKMTTMVRCTPTVVERKIYVTRHHRHDKRVWIAD